MSKNKIDYNMLEEAFKSAPLTENIEEKNEKKQKLLSLPVEWEIKIKKHFKGSVSNYILISIYDRMKKDGII